ncbi:MAG: HepT-like ribonuclease domain-containing protein [Armatimonadia bacterium]
MNGDIRKYLFDIARAAADATEFIENVSFGDYTQRKLVRAAVERQLIIIGEAVIHLRKRAPEYTSVLSADVSSIVAFRNRLVHGYDTVDDAIVYKIATRDLPALRQEVLALLESSQ